MNALIRGIVLRTIALLLSAIFLLTPGTVFAHDPYAYRAGYHRGFENGYRVGYREALEGDDYSNHFPDGYDSYTVGFHDGQHAGYDAGYRRGCYRPWYYHGGW